MAPMGSAALHRLARVELGPLLLDMGFTRTPNVSTASWVRPQGDRWTVIWLQPSRSTAPDARGSEFTIEFRLSSRPETGGDGYRRRLPTFLAEQERERLRRANLLRRPGTDDPWFGHTNEADARALMAVFQRVLPTAIDRFLEEAEAANGATGGATPPGR